MYTVSAVPDVLGIRLIGSADYVSCSELKVLCDVEEVPYLKDIQKLIGKDVPVAGGHMFETAEVKEAVAEKKKAMKEESKRRNMFGNKRDGSFWRNKKRTANK